MDDSGIIITYVTCGTALFINILLLADSATTFLSGTLEIKRARAIIIAGIIQTVIYTADFHLFCYNYYGVRMSGIISSSLVYVFNMMFLLAYANLIYFKYEKKLFNLKINRTLFLTPVLFTMALSALNIFFPIIFDISPETFEYTETAWVILPNVVTVMYLLFAGVNDIRQWRHNPVYNILPMSLYFVPSAIGSVVETIYPMIPVVPIFCAMCIMIMYVRVLKHIGYVDELSGLFTKPHIEVYINSRLRKLSADEKLAGLMLDVNSFKNINDTFGHVAGDRAIEKVGEILRDVTRKTGVCFRYGGDEFVVLFTAESQNDITRLVLRINRAFDGFNARKTEPFVLTLSQGSAVYDAASDSSVTFIERMDAEMYKDKQAYKLAETV